MGQNFLNKKKILEEMARVAKLSKKDVVLEVGAGLGSLTKILAARAKKVIAVEKDRELIPFLKEKFSKEKHVEIIEGDILKFENFKLKIGNFKLVANIPYYITGNFLRKFLSDNKLRPQEMVIMIQKEVADRILARDKKESLLSISVKAYGKPEFVRKISRGNFSPPPKVDSAIIKISGVSNKWFFKNKINEEKFFEILRLAFQKKRKMLRASIGKIISLPEKFTTKRPEKLSLDDWGEILK